MAVLVNGFYLHTQADTTGMCGPVVREGAKEAMLALRNQAPQLKDKVGT